MGSPCQTGGSFSGRGDKGSRANLSLWVRASAGRGSFRRKARLEECLEAAQARVEGLAQEREHSDSRVTRRERAARERVAQVRAARVEEALKQLPEVRAVKERQKRHAG